MKPNALINVKTWDILSWGYCDFSNQVDVGTTKQIEAINKPPDKLFFCCYNPISEKIEKKTDNEIAKIQNTEKEISRQGNLLTQEMHNLAIESLKKKGKL